MQDQKDTVADNIPQGAGAPPDSQINPSSDGDIRPNLEELLKKAEQEAQEHRDAWIRAKADADNIRKRAQTDIANAHKYALENFAGELLAVRDSLEAALGSENSAVEALRGGVELTLRQLSGAFEKAAIRQIDPLGEKFDPHRHQSISMVEADAEPNTVVGVLQKGYSLHERILRPALVSLAKPRANANP